MIISELVKPKGLDDVRSDMAASSSDNWMRVIKTFFKKYGFKKAGRGTFGYVAIKEDYPYAIKVFRNDTSYLKWYRFCKENQHNPFIPKFKGKVIKMVDDIYYVRLEKLLSTSSSASRSEVDALFLRTIYKIQDYADDNIDMQWLRPTGNDAIDEIAEELIANSRLLDIWQGNIMKREDGRVVLIDPYYDEDNVRK